PAQVHQEGAVRHVDDPYPPDAADLVDDLLAVLLVARLERDVAGDGALADLDQVDGADVSAGLADGRRDLAEHARPVDDLDANDQAVAGAGGADHGRTSLMVSASGRTGRPASPRGERGAGRGDGTMRCIVQQPARVPADGGRGDGER